jgi:hypothetical protein
MGYGLYVETFNGNLIIDSDRTKDSGTIVVHEGYGSAPYANYTPPSNTTSVVFVNTSVSSGSYKFIQLKNGMFLDQNNNSISVNYIILQQAKDLTSTTSLKSGSYGLQVFNADNDEVFDSRYYSGQGGGFALAGYFPYASIIGNYYSVNNYYDGYIYASGGASNNRITSNLSHYVGLVQVGTWLTTAFNGIVAFNNFNITSGSGTSIFTGSNSTATNQVFSGYYPIRWRPTPMNLGGYDFWQNFSDIPFGEFFS